MRPDTVCVWLSESPYGCDVQFRILAPLVSPLHVPESTAPVPISRECACLGRGCGDCRVVCPLLCLLLLLSYSLLTVVYRYVCVSPRIILPPLCPLALLSCPCLVVPWCVPCDRPCNFCPMSGSCRLPVPVIYNPMMLLVPSYPCCVLSRILCVKTVPRHCFRCGRIRSPRWLVLWSRRW